MTYAEHFRPVQTRRAAFYDVGLVIGGSLLIAASAQVSVHLPFSPVPVTGQTFAVLLVGALLGWQRGMLAVLAYLMQGLAGLPVFAGGLAGPMVLLGPTGGYLIGFVAAAGLTGWLAQRGWDRHNGSMLLAMLLGSAAIYLFGVPRLAAFVGWDVALTAGFWPFLIGDVVKAVLAMLLLPLGWRLLAGQGTD
ncbi:biotin transporter BioY [Chloroflexota bacterium]